MRAKLIVAATCALLAMVAAVPSTAASPPVLPGTSCTVFPTDNVWNMDISKLPVSTNSAKVITTDIFTVAK